MTEEIQPDPASRREVSQEELFTQARAALAKLQAGRSAPRAVERPGRYSLYHLLVIGSGIVGAGYLGLLAGNVFTQAPPEAPAGPAAVPTVPAPGRLPDLVSESLGSPRPVDATTRPDSRPGGGSRAREPKARAIAEPTPPGRADPFSRTVSGLQATQAAPSLSRYGNRIAVGLRSGIAPPAGAGRVELRLAGVAAGAGGRLALVIGQQAGKPFLRRVRVGDFLPPDFKVLAIDQHQIRLSNGVRLLALHLDQVKTPQ